MLAGKIQKKIKQILRTVFSPIALGVPTPDPATPSFDYSDTYRPDPLAITVQETTVVNISLEHAAGVARVPIAHTDVRFIMTRHLAGPPILQVPSTADLNQITATMGTASMSSLAA